MKKVVNFCDYFVLCSGTSERHLKTIADEVDEGVNKAGQNLKVKSSLKKSDWIVFDAGSVVVHIFLKQTRDFYRLEYLWQDAKNVDWKK